MGLKLRGGYNLRLAGRPDAAIETLPDPDVLYLPLRSRRFTFSEVHVKEGEDVLPGEVLASDPGNSNVPLLAPCAGGVRLDEAPGHIVLEAASSAAAAAPPVAEEDAGRHPQTGEGCVRCHQLLRLGAWQFFEDAHTGRLPPPDVRPRAVIVSTVRLEPFLVRGDALLKDHLATFARGLQHVQSLLEYQPIYLVMPDLDTPLAMAVRDMASGLAWLKVVGIRLKYPHDHPALIARGLGLMRKDGEPVWAIQTDGVLAVERALGHGMPVLRRVVALGGPAADRPRHVELPVGYPLDRLVDAGAAEARAGPVRVVCGGALTGEAASDKCRGACAECAGLTFLPEPAWREFLGFLRPGWNRPSFSRCFASALHRVPRRPLTTATYGEPRACVACGLCEQVCPARILPHVIHKALYARSLDDAERLRVDLCVRCGLCALVCPSKIELLSQFIEAQDALRAEHAEAEAAAAAAEAGEAAP